MELQHQLEVEDILKHYKEKVAEQIQEIVILKATIDSLTKPKPVEPTTTAVQEKPNVDGPKGI
jgi:hypothetical protein